MTAPSKFIYGKDQPKLTEPAFQRTIIENAQVYGWIRSYHTHNSMRSNPGYPDLTLHHPEHGALWLEVKGAKGEVRLNQVAYVQDIRICGLHAYIVFPQDIQIVDALLRGEIDPPVRPHGIIDPRVQPLLENEGKARR